MGPTSTLLSVFTPLGSCVSKPGCSALVFLDIRFAPLLRRARRPYPVTPHPATNLIEDCYDPGTTCPPRERSTFDDMCRYTRRSLAVNKKRNKMGCQQKKPRKCCCRYDGVEGTGITIIFPRSRCVRLPALLLPFLRSPIAFLLLPAPTSVTRVQICLSSRRCSWLWRFWWPHSRALLR